MAIALETGGRITGTHVPGADLGHTKFLHMPIKSVRMSQDGESIGPERVAAWFGWGAKLKAERIVRKRANGGITATENPYHDYLRTKFLQIPVRSVSIYQDNKFLKNERVAAWTGWGAVLKAETIVKRRMNGGITGTHVPGADYRRTKVLQIPIQAVRIYRDGEFMGVERVAARFGWGAVLKAERTIKARLRHR